MSFPLMTSKPSTKWVKAFISVYFKQIRDEIKTKIIYFYRSSTYFFILLSNVTNAIKNLKAIAYIIKFEFLQLHFPIF